MAIAFQRECPDLRPAAVLAHVERDPAVVTHVGRYLVARIIREEALPVHADPEPEAHSAVEHIRLGKAALARAPHRHAELPALVGFGQRKTDLAQGLEYALRMR